MKCPALFFLAFDHPKRVLIEIVFYLKRLLFSKILEKIFATEENGKYFNELVYWLIQFDYFMHLG